MANNLPNGGAGQSGSIAGSSLSIDTITIAVNAAAINPIPPILDPRIAITSTNVGVAPDGSGKALTQYGAFINNAITGYPSLGEVQAALLGAAATAGFNNFLWSSSAPTTSCILLVW